MFFAWFEIFVSLLSKRNFVRYWLRCTRNTVPLSNIHIITPWVEAVEQQFICWSLIFIPSSIVRKMNIIPFVKTTFKGINNLFIYHSKRNNLFDKIYPRNTYKDYLYQNLAAKYWKFCLYQFPESCARGAEIVRGGILRHFWRRDFHPNSSQRIEKPAFLPLLTLANPRLLKKRFPSTSAVQTRSSSSHWPFIYI